MAGKTTTQPANHLRAWRERARLSQSQLAEKADTSVSVISEIESGKQQLSSKWLRRLAPILGTTPGRLLDSHPDEIDTADEMFRELMGVPEHDRAHVIDIIKTFQRKARG